MVVGCLAAYSATARGVPRRRHNISAVVGLGRSPDQRAKLASRRNAPAGI